MYQFRYMLSEQEYFDFNIYHAFNSPTCKKNIQRNRFIPPIMFAICGLSLGTVVEEPVTSFYFYATFGIAAILWLIFFKWIMKKMITKNIKRLKKNGKLPYQHNVTISFEDDHYIETTEKGEARVKYSAIERVVTVDKAIYIYTDAIQALLLPFAVFSNEQERDDFISFITQKIVAME